MPGFEDEEFENLEDFNTVVENSEHVDQLFDTKNSEEFLV